MAEEFLSDNSNPPTDGSLMPERDREAVRVMVVGSRRGITRIIHKLYIQDFAQMHEWSQPIPEPNSGKLLSVATKYVDVD